MEDIILNAPVVIECPSENNELSVEFFEESALLDKLVELKGDCFFNVFIGKYSYLFYSLLLDVVTLQHVITHVVGW